jgi:hypothetical protein
MISVWFSAVRRQTERVTERCNQESAYRHPQPRVFDIHKTEFYLSFLRASSISSTVTSISFLNSMPFTAESNFGRTQRAL